MRHLSTALWILVACAGELDVTESEWKRLSQSHWEEADAEPANACNQDGCNELIGDPLAEEVGRQLFFDTGLSADQTVSCDTCHDVSTSGADPRGAATSVGALGSVTPRNAPTVLGSGLRASYSWFGTEPSLWGQIIKPLTGAFHGSLTDGEIAGLVCARVPEELLTLGIDCESASDGDIVDATAMVMAAYVRTLDSTDSCFDRFLGGSFAERDLGAMSEEALRGAKLFVGRASCDECHRGHTFSDGETHLIGVNTSPLEVDEHGELRTYQTPALRSISSSAPYMHDGGFASLWDVLEFYRAGGDTLAGGATAVEVQPLELSDTDLLDLEAFLRSLDGAQLPYCWVSDDPTCCTSDGSALANPPDSCAALLAPDERVCP